MAAENLEYEMAKDLEAMRAWLIERISKALRVKGSMDPDAPLSAPNLWATRINNRSNLVIL